MGKRDLRQIPELDGLRGLAVLAVVAFHGTTFITGGWVGVDIFFVLSGFLITRILAAEISNGGTVNGPNFYKRRVLRLAPAYVVMLLFTVPLLLGPLSDTLVVSPITAVATSVLNVANWAQVYRPQGTGPLIHTWSLSIEEQFYLIWPTLLIGLLRVRKPLTWILVAIVGCAVLTAGLSASVSPGRLMFVTTSQGIGLLVGAALALKPVRCPTWLGWGCLLILGVICLRLSNVDGALFLGGYLVIALLAAGVIANSFNGVGSLCAALRFSPLRFVGKVSYGLYLYHFPIFQYFQHATLGDNERRFLELVISVAVTVISYYLVEKPFLAMKAGKAIREPVEAL